MSQSDPASTAGSTVTFPDVVKCLTAALAGVFSPEVVKSTMNAAIEALKIPGCESSIGEALAAVKPAPVSATKKKGKSEERTVRRTSVYGIYVAKIMEQLRNHPDSFLLKKIDPATSAPYKPFKVASTCWGQLSQEQRDLFKVAYQPVADLIYDEDVKERPIESISSRIVDLESKHPVALDPRIADVFSLSYYEPKTPKAKKLKGQKVAEPSGNVNGANTIEKHSVAVDFPSTPNAKAKLGPATTDAEESTFNDAGGKTSGKKRKKDKEKNRDGAQQEEMPNNLPPLGELESVGDHHKKKKKKKKDRAES